MKNNERQNNKTAKVEQMARNSHRPWKLRQHREKEENNEKKKKKKQRNKYIHRTKMHKISIKQNRNKSQEKKKKEEK